MNSALFVFKPINAIAICCALLWAQAGEASTQSISTAQGSSGSASASRQTAAIFVDDGSGGATDRISIAPMSGHATTTSGYGGSVDTYARVAIADVPRNDNVSTSRGAISGQFFNFVSMSRGRIGGGLPLAYSRLSSQFGMRRHPVTGGYLAHNGIDLTAPMGTPVTAAGDGIVSKATYFGSYGLYVAVEHGNGTQSRYAHLSRLNVAPGQQVRAGDVIGFVGSTGRSTGPHLHFEVRRNGLAVDPLTALNR